MQLEGENNFWSKFIFLTHGTGQQQSSLFLTADKDYWLKTTFFGVTDNISYSKEKQASDTNNKVLFTAEN